MLIIQADVLQWKAQKRRLYVAWAWQNVYFIDATMHHGQRRAELIVCKHDFGIIRKGSQREIAVGRIGWLMRVAEIHEAQNAHYS